MATSTRSSLDGRFLQSSKRLSKPKRLWKRTPDCIGIGLEALQFPSKTQLQSLSISTNKRGAKSAPFLVFYTKISTNVSTPVDNSVDNSVDNLSTPVDNSVDNYLTNFHTLFFPRRLDSYPNNVMMWAIRLAFPVWEMCIGKSNASMISLVVVSRAPSPRSVMILLTL